MATWISHIMIADYIIDRMPDLDKKGFCVGSIAPDCNIENEDWTYFEPSRELTHWMHGASKLTSDYEGFYTKYIADRKSQIASNEELSFLLGYYAHLITDAELQRFIWDKSRIKAAWSRLKEDEELVDRAKDFPETWDALKKIIPRNERMQVSLSVEAEYLKKNSGSGYMTEILPLKSFPNYIDYLPPGSIVRKIGIMGGIPVIRTENVSQIAMSEEEYRFFIYDTAKTVLYKIKTNSAFYGIQFTGNNGL